MELTYCDPKAVYEEWHHLPRVRRRRRGGSYKELVCRQKSAESSPWGELNNNELDLSRLIRYLEASSRNQTSVEETFEELYRTWTRETSFLSSIDRMAMHPAYQRIIGLGKPAIRLMLRKLEDSPAHWFWALAAVTGENPVRAEDAGDVPRMAETWLAWGRERGYL